MEHVGSDIRIVLPGEEPLRLAFSRGEGHTFFNPKIRVSGNPRIYKVSRQYPRPTYQIGRIVFLDGYGLSLKSQYLEQEGMNFGFWAVASGFVSEKIQHYDDSIERRGSGNYECFLGPNSPGGIQVPIPGLPVSDTQYMKEPLTPFDDLLPEDFDQSLCRVRVKKMTSLSEPIPYTPGGCFWTFPSGEPPLPVTCATAWETNYLVYYESEIDGERVRYRGHEDNGFTRYFDPRRHGNGQWAQGFAVELFPDAGEVLLQVEVDIYGGM